MEQNRCEKSTLLLATVIGVALHGTYSSFLIHLLRRGQFSHSSV